jgi:hypothetical protein
LEEREESLAEVDDDNMDEDMMSLEEISNSSFG